MPAFRQEFPQDSFDAHMRWSEKHSVWQPRIRCNDCPGTLYNTEEEDPTRNFRIHLLNQKHLRARAARDT